MEGPNIPKTDERQIGVFSLDVYDEKAKERKTAILFEGSPREYVENDPKCIPT
jgi:hypothetical protein